MQHIPIKVIILLYFISANFSISSQSVLRIAPPQVSTVAMEALAILSENLPKSKADIIYQAVERLYSDDSDIMSLVVHRLDEGSC